MPTFRQLEVFSAAAMDGSFRKAAESLGISQPAVSDQIATLEEEIGCKLFIRQRGSVAKLSPAGHRILAQVRMTLQAKNDIALAIDPLRHEVAKLRICTRSYFFETRLRESLHAFLDDNPQIDLEFHIVNETPEIINLVRRKKVDVAVYRGDVPNEPGLAVEVLEKLSVSIYAAPHFAQQWRSNPAALHTFPFLLNPTDSANHEWELRCLMDSGITPKIVAARSRIPEVVLAWIMEGKGIAVRYDENMERFVKSGEVVAIGPRLPATVYTIMLQSRNPQSTSVSAAIRLVRDLLGKSVNARSTTPLAGIRI